MQEGRAKDTADNRRESGTEIALERRTLLKAGSMMVVGGIASYASTGWASTGASREVRQMFERSERAQRLAKWMASQGVEADWSSAGLYTLTEAYRDKGVPAEQLFGAMALDRDNQLKARRTLVSDGRPRGRQPQVLVLQLKSRRSDRRGTIVVHKSGEAYGMMLGTRQVPAKPLASAQKVRVRFA